MKYFKLNEFDSPDSTGSGKNMKENMLIKLENSRELAGIPFVINSGFRTKEYNAKIGGVKNSSHTKGLAVDIKCSNSNERFKILNAVLRVGFRRIGIGENFIHLDDDKSKPQKLIWTYKTKK